MRVHCDSETDESVARPGIRERSVLDERIELKVCRTALDAAVALPIYCLASLPVTSRASPQAMELLQQEWDMDQSLRGAEQDGLRLKMAKVNRMGLVRGLVKGPQAKANAAWLNSKTGMGPEAAKQILTGEWAPR